MKAVTSALTWAFIAIVVLVAFPVMLVVRLFDWSPVHRATGRTFRWFGGLIPLANPAWKLTVTGTPPASMRQPLVVVSNHQSNADIPLVSRLPWEMKWVGKRSLFQIPVLGWEMRLADDIAVDRGSPESRAAVMLRARRVLSHDCPVMFFAEGTRSRDGRLKRFHDGAFRLAIETGAPVLPLAIDGTKDALPTQGWLFNAADVRLHIFEPVPTTGLTEADVPRLREHVRGLVRDQIAAWRGVAPEEVDALALEAA